MRTTSNDLPVLGYVDSMTDQPGPPINLALMTFDLLQAVWMF